MLLNTVRCLVLRTFREFVQTQHKLPLPMSTSSEHCFAASVSTINENSKMKTVSIDRKHALPWCQTVQYTDVKLHDKPSSKPSAACCYLYVVADPGISHNSLLPFLSHSPPFPFFLPLRSRPPLHQLRDLKKRCKLPQRGPGGAVPENEVDAL